MTDYTRIQVRRDTSATWTTINPVLFSGEFGLETDTLKVKIGDGSTVWTSLAYVGAGGGVTSVNGQTGVVSLTTDDIEETVLNPYYNDSHVAAYLAAAASMNFRGVVYGWPTVQGAAATVLTNDGSGGLTWAPAGGGGGSSVVDVTLSTSDIIGLFATPIQLVPAPAPGLAIVVESIEALSIFNTAPFIADSNLTIKYAGLPEFMTMDFELTSSSQTGNVRAYTLSPQFGIGNSLVPATAVQVSTNGPLFAPAALGSIKLRVKYHTITVLTP